MIVQGFVAGVAHVLTGPDHLAGVAPFAVGEPRRLRPSLVGASWGLGHGLGVVLVGLLGQTVLSAADVEIGSGWAERLVGAVLVVLGLVTLRRARDVVVHEHAHAHGDGRDGVHVHLHVHDGRGLGAAEHDGSTTPPHRHRHAAFGVGVLHGVAGAGHLWAVIPSLAMTPRDAAIYIGGYLAASIAVMAAFGAVVGSLTRAFGDRAVPRLLVVAGAGSIAVGVFWLATV